MGLKQKRKDFSSEKKEKGLSIKKRLMSNIFFGSFTGLVSKVGAFLFTIIIARAFFPELFGLYSLALTIILVVAAISDLGIASTAVRFLAESIGKKKFQQTRSRFWFLLKSRLIVSFCFAFLLFLNSGLIAIFFKKPELIIPLKIGSVYLIIVGLHSFFTAVFGAFQKLKYSAISETIFQISRVALLLLSFFFFKSIEGIFIILSISLVFSIFFSVNVLFKKYPSLINGKKEYVERRRLAKFSFFLSLSTITILIFSNIDKLVLGYFLDLEFVGFYSAIFTIVGGVLGLLAITSVFSPVFTQLKKERLTKAFKKAFHCLSIISFPATIGLAFVLFPLLKIIYGPEYVPLQYEFSLLLTTIFLSLIVLETVFSSMYTVLFNSQERPKIPAFTNLFTSVFNLILNIVLISFLIKIDISYGLIGASLATFFSRYVGMFVLMFLAKKRTGIFPDLSSIFKPLFSSLVMLLYLFVFYYFVPRGILQGILMILSAAILYLVIIFKLKATSIKELKSFFKK